MIYNQTYDIMVAGEEVPQALIWYRYYPADPGDQWTPPQPASVEIVDVFDENLEPAVLDADDIDNLEGLENDLVEGHSDG